MTPTPPDEAELTRRATATTFIRTLAPYATVINFLHVDRADQARVTNHTVRVAQRLEGAAGSLAINVLRSLDGSRVLTYSQWMTEDAFLAAERQSGAAALLSEIRPLLENDALSRFYRVVYADDRSPEGVTVIDPAYAGTIFVNEITTRPETQDRLLELVISNNEAQSQLTAGYRSANFHQSTDGQRAVNYSLWDSQEQCIDAISAMADMDPNLEETVQIANPDFRFYTLVHPIHA